MFTVFGGNGSASMSATEWIGASQVMRSRWGSSTGRRPPAPMRSGSSSQASGRPSATIRYSSGSVSTSTGVPRVVALEVDRVDGAGGGQLGDQLLGPGVGRVELEARARVALEQAVEPCPRSRALVGRSPPGASRPRRSAAAARGPPPRRATCPPGAAPGRAPRTRTPSGGSCASPRARAASGTGRACRAARPASRACGCPHRSACRPGVLEGHVVEAVVDHVLADALLAAAVQRDRAW